MRLYLSSENVGDHAERLVRMVGDKKRVAYIPNARDFWEDKIASDEKTQTHRQQFQDLGFDFDVFDLKKYFGEKKLSVDMFKDFGLIWAPGGNTFLLRRAMHDSGLDEVLMELLGKDALVYGGSSAGAIISTPSLHGTDIGDRPQDVEQIYGKEILWDGLGLINVYLSVHVGTEWFLEESKRVSQYFEHKNLPFIELQDGHVLVVEGETQEVLR